ncbi:hypothetical protein B0T24DRAFT_235111 [Lasiosphaeria ovina]|uniref:F-box domain-containing protein n=1 Tax=Lasiosphaeria ovina TaxID=92902 RepID=A0AAE0KJF1_9PEZI|nr:hypothetical protein B0T24DRAFT_235111 [Lasiosphaeria ovina]
MRPPISAILCVPDELLAQILELVLAYPTRSWWAPDFDKFFRTSVSVMLVCRRFRRLATPYLYRHVEVAAGSVGPNFPAASPRATRHLHRTFSQDPSLRRYCRILHVHFAASDSEAPWQIVDDLATWLVGTQHLLIDGAFDPGDWDDWPFSIRRTVRSGHNLKRTWDFIRTAFRNMASLEEVSIRTGNGLLSLWTIIHNLRHAVHLRVVSLAGVSCTGSTLPDNAFQTRSALITSLRLSNFQDGPENLRRLLLFPAKLEEFSFASFRLDRTGPWNLSVVASALSPHKSTLRSLLVGSLGEKSGSLTGVDLSEFTRLEELSLSYWATGSEAGTEAQLLAPGLRAFSWSFHLEDQQSESYFDFQEPQEKWLRTLVHTAVEERVPLRKLQITFVPSDYGKPGEARPKEWPWDCMDRVVGKEMQDLGVTLSHGEPTISRKDFLERGVEVEE